MVAARFAAALLVALAVPLTAQNTPDYKVVIKVVDVGYGQAIRGARIGIVQLPSAFPNDGDYFQYAIHASELVSTQANAHGLAVVRLAKGSYVIKIVAEGFAHTLQRVEIRDQPTQLLVVKLSIAATG